ncbi:hypothetical protein NMY22_g6391 [Coprinellus aureogranulatus]|nr:hypothetical protein NMY22_g6391 [Coprinellus aureogranulatus]
MDVTGRLSLRSGTIQAPPPTLQDPASPIRTHTSNITRRPIAPLTDTQARLPRASSVSGFWADLVLDLRAYGAEPGSRMKHDASSMCSAWLNEERKDESDSFRFVRRHGAKVDDLTLRLTPRERDIGDRLWVNATGLAEEGRYGRTPEGRNTGRKAKPGSTIDG